VEWLEWLRLLITGIENFSTGRPKIVHIFEHLVISPIQKLSLNQQQNNFDVHRTIPTCPHLMHILHSFSTSWHYKYVSRVPDSDRESHLNNFTFHFHTKKMFLIAYCVCTITNSLQHYMYLHMHKITCHACYRYFYFIYIFKCWGDS
jgi:hypothetical protein